MEELVLTWREVSCLAAGLGASELIGCPDAFAGVPQAMLRSEINRVVRSLTARKLLTEEAAVAPACAALLAPVARCDRYASALKQDGPKESGSLRFYLKESRIVAVNTEGENCTLRRIGPEEFRNALLGFVNWEALGGTLPAAHGELEQRSFAALKKRPSVAAVRALTKAGLPEQAAKLVSDGFFLRDAFYSFAFLRVRARTDAVRGLQFMGDQRGIVTLNTFIKDDLNYVSLDTTEPNLLRQALEQEIQWFLQPERRA